MPPLFPATSVNLLSKLKDTGEESEWNVSWKRFLELYHEPILAITHSCYRHHTGGQVPNPGFIEDAAADTITEFFTKGQHRYDRSKGRLRTYLRVLINARVVDLLRKERPIDHQPLPDDAEAQASSFPAESPAESEAFHRALLATLVEDLRHRIPQRQFEIYERVKLKNQSASYVAEDLAITRAMVDRNIHKAMTALRQIATQPEYQEEFHP